MNELNLAFNANSNLKEQPNNITVHGSVMVYSDGAEIKIDKSESPGINTKILLLDLKINDNQELMKGYAKHFSFEEHGNHISNYSQVQITTNKGDVETVQVEVFG
jgi:hypothetical protein